MVVARLLLQFVAVPYVANLMVKDSTWSVSELHVGKEIPCVDMSPAYTCYECRSTIEVSDIQFDAEFMLPPVPIFIKSGVGESFLGYKIFPTLTLTGGASTNKFVSNGDLIASVPLSNSLDPLTDPVEAWILASVDVQLFGFTVTDVLMRKSFLIPLRNFSIAV